MTSTITLYKTNITPERNCRVDSLESYLTSCTKEIINDFQYKIIKLDDFIKLNRNQEDTPSFPFNYLSVKREDDDKIYYYFILNTNWKSANTIELQISLDTINTFWNELKWTSKTNITRQHKDRFKPRQTYGDFNNMRRIIDKYDEGITPVKLVKSSQKLTITDADYDWYLIYKNKDNVTTSTNTPIDCFCLSDYAFEMNIDPTQNGINISQMKNNQSIFIMSNDNDTFTAKVNAGGVTTTFQIGKNANYKGVQITKRNNVGIAYFLSDSEARAVSGLTGEQLTNAGEKTLCHQYDDFDYYPEDYLTTLGQLQLQGESYDFFIGSLSGGKLNIMSSIDRTDTKIIKIIKMPYAPFNISFTGDKLNVPTGWIYTKGMLKLEDLNTEFLTTVKTPLINVTELNIEANTLDNDTEHNQDYESKLYNSSYYQLKYCYDSFIKEFFLERYTPSSNDSDTARLNIQFKQSNNISSNSLFDFKMERANYQEPTLYSRYLNVNRQNEVALYTSEYLNYIRTGYNYDRKIKSQQAAVNWTVTGLNIAASIASFALSGVTSGISAAAGVSLAASAVASIATNINNTVQSEQNIQQKLDQLQKQSSSVSNTEDLNLLSYYNGNRLIKTVEQCSDEMRDAVYHLFRLTGYACNDYDIPDFNSRCYYNYVQCSPVFDESQWNYGQDFLNDVKARFQIGVTVFHHFRDKYNWNQDLEDFETWLVNRD